MHHHHTAGRPHLLWYFDRFDLSPPPRVFWNGNASPYLFLFCLRRDFDQRPLICVFTIDYKPILLCARNARDELHQT
jgi:hypothetical protein